MNYYPQSMGTMGAPFVPYLDQLAVGGERVVYQPHLQTIVPSGGSAYSKRNPIHPPTITVQCETGMFACNYHEIRKDVMVDDENELIVPPWLERTPTPTELAIEEKFRHQEEHWENKYWAEMEKKMKETAKQQERVENAGRRPTVTSNVLKPGVSAHSSPSHIQKADSFRRVLKKEGSAKSGAASSRNGAGGVAQSDYTGSECGTARPHLERKNSVTSSVASKSVGGARGVAAVRTSANSRLRADDVRSITSSNQRYKIAHDRTETESICSIISSVYSDDDVVRKSATLRSSAGGVAAGLGASTSGKVGASTSKSGKVSAANSRGGTSAAGLSASGHTSSRTTKMSPRQRMLQQQQEQMQQSQHHRMGSSSSSSLIGVVPPSPSSSPLAGGAGVPTAQGGPLPTNNTSSMTTPFTSRCFTVAEGTEPFAWGSPSPVVSAWLREMLDEASPKLADTAGSGKTTAGLSDASSPDAAVRAGSPPASKVRDVTPAPVGTSPSPAGAHDATTAAASPEGKLGSSSRANSVERGPADIEGATRRPSVETGYGTNTSMTNVDGGKPTNTSVTTNDSAVSGNNVAPTPSTSGTTKPSDANSNSLTDGGKVVAGSSAAKANAAANAQLANTNKNTTAAASNNNSTTDVPVAKQKADQKSCCVVM